MSQSNFPGGAEIRRIYDEIRAIDVARDALLFHRKIGLAVRRANVDGPWPASRRNLAIVINELATQLGVTRHQLSIAASIARLHAWEFNFLASLHLPFGVVKEAALAPVGSCVAWAGTAKLFRWTPRELHEAIGAATVAERAPRAAGGR